MSPSGPRIFNEKQKEKQSNPARFLFEYDLFKEENMHTSGAASHTRQLIGTLNIAKVEKSHQFVLCPVPAFVPLTWRIKI